MESIKNLTGYAEGRTTSNSYWFMGCLLTFFSTGKETGGQFSLFEALVRGDYEVPLHTHTREDESFYILEGELECMVGDKIYHGKAGDFIFLPRNVQHSWKTLSKLARFLVWITPAGIENAFLAFCKPANALELPPVEAISEELMIQVVMLDNEYGVTYAFQTQQ